MGVRRQARLKVLPSKLLNTGGSWSSSNLGFALGRESQQEMVWSRIERTEKVEGLWQMAVSCSGRTKSRIETGDLTGHVAKDIPGGQSVISNLDEIGRVRVKP